MRRAYRQTVDLCSIIRASGEQRDRREWLVKAYNNVLNDPRKDERLAKPECVICFYVDNRRIGGAMTTSRQCGVCQRVMSFCSTCTDAVCPACAKAHDLCRHCGGDIRLRVRRQFDQAAVLPTLADDA